MYKYGNVQTDNRQTKTNHTHLLMKTLKTLQPQGGKSGQ